MTGQRPPAVHSLESPPMQLLIAAARDRLTGARTVDRIDLDDSDWRAIIALASLPEAQAGNPVTGQIRDKLSQRGYRFAGPEAAGQHHLQYRVSRYGQEVLLRVTLDGVEASVLFARDAQGVLKAAAPLAMRQKGKAPS